MGRKTWQEPTHLGSLLMQMFQQNVREPRNEQSSVLGDFVAAKCSEEFLKSLGTIGTGTSPCSVRRHTARRFLAENLEARLYPQGKHPGCKIVIFQTIFHMIFGCCDDLTLILVSGRCATSIASLDLNRYMRSWPARWSSKVCRARSVVWDMWISWLFKKYQNVLKWTLKRLYNTLTIIRFYTVIIYCLYYFCDLWAQDCNPTRSLCRIMQELPSLSAGGVFGRMTALGIRPRPYSAISFFAGEHCCVEATIARNHPVIWQSAIVCPSGFASRCGGSGIGNVSRSALQDPDARGRQEGSRTEPWSLKPELVGTCGSRLLQRFFWQEVLSTLWRLWPTLEYFPTCSFDAVVSAFQLSSHTAQVSWVR